MREEIERREKEQRDLLNAAPEEETGDLQTTSPSPSNSVPQSTSAPHHQQENEESEEESGPEEEENDPDESADESRRVQNMELQTTEEGLPLPGAMMSNEKTVGKLDKSEVMLDTGKENTKVGEVKKDKDEADSDDNSSSSSSSDSTASSDSSSDEAEAKEEVKKAGDLVVRPKYPKTNLKRWTTTRTSTPFVRKVILSRRKYRQSTIPEWIGKCHPAVAQYLHNMFLFFRTVFC